MIGRNPMKKLLQNKDPIQDTVLIVPCAQPYCVCGRSFAAAYFYLCPLERCAQDSGRINRHAPCPKRTRLPCRGLYDFQW